MHIPLSRDCLRFSRWHTAVERCGKAASKLVVPRRAEAVAGLKRSLDTDGMLASNINTLEAKSLTPQNLQTLEAAFPPGR